MSGPAGGVRAARIDWRRLSLAIAAVCAAVFVAANAHLVYVAIASQPECVAHSKTAGEAGSFRAARSAC